MSISERFDANAVVYGSQLYTWQKHNVLDITLWALDHGNPRRACSSCDRWDGFFDGTTDKRSRKVTLDTAARPPGLLGRVTEEALTWKQTRWVSAMMELWRSAPWGPRQVPPIRAAAEMAGITEGRSRLYYYSPRFASIRQEFEATKADDVRQSCHGCYASFFEQEFSPGEREARFREMKAGRKAWRETLDELVDHEEKLESISHPKTLKLWKRTKSLLEKRLKDIRSELLDLGHDPLKVAASGGLYV